MIKAFYIHLLVFCNFKSLGNVVYNISTQFDGDVCFNLVVNTADDSNDGKLHGRMLYIN